MESCKLCGGARWLSVRVEPVGGEDFGPVDYDDDACYLCNPNGEFGWSSSIDTPYFFAQALGGYEGQYGVFNHFVDSVFVRSILIDRKVINYSSWQPLLALDDCPVCHGWGVWSNNGHIQDCLACGGQPIEARQGYEPLYAFWVNWKLGHTEMLTPRGTGSLNDLEESRRSSPTVTPALINTLENTPGITRVS